MFNGIRVCWMGEERGKKIRGGGEKAGREEEEQLEGRSG